MPLHSRWLAVLLLSSALFGADKKGEEHANILFQVSTLDALAQGIYQGALSFRELKQHGNFGVGTFASLDGEMIALDGKFFQVRSDGTVGKVEGDDATPFAAVTAFEANLRLRLSHPASLAELTALIDQLLPSKNLFYAVKVRGRFSDITTRSVPKQYPPFPPLADAIAQQTLFPLSNVSGTLVGFRSPAFIKGINQVGYHFHFITDDEHAGGHALSFQIAEGTVEIGILRQHSTFLPGNQPFQNATLPLP